MNDISNSDVLEKALVLQLRIEKQGFNVIIQRNGDTTLFTTGVTVTDTVHIWINWTYSNDELLNADLDELANEHVATARKVYMSFFPVKERETSRLYYLEANKLILDVEAYANVKFGSAGVSLFYSAFERVYAHFWKLLEKAELKAADKK